MAKTVKLTSSNGLGWRFGDDGLRVVSISTVHNYAWTAERGGGIPAGAVTNSGEEVTHLGEIVTNGV